MAHLHSRPLHDEDYDNDEAVEEDANDESERQTFPPVSSSVSTSASCVINIHQTCQFCHTRKEDDTSISIIAVIAWRRKKSHANDTNNNNISNSAIRSSSANDNGVGSHFLSYCIPMGD